MIEIAGGIILALIGLAAIIAAIVWWPVTLLITVCMVIAAWLKAHGVLQ